MKLSFLSISAAGSNQRFNMRAASSRIGAGPGSEKEAARQRGKAEDWEAICWRHTFTTSQQAIGTGNNGQHSDHKIQRHNPHLAAHIDSFAGRISIHFTFKYYETQGLNPIFANFFKQPKIAQITIFANFLSESFLATKR